MIWYTKYMNKNILYVNDSGFLDVGDGHKIYYEDWGNKKSTPIMYFHGGPGAHFSNSHKSMFNPKKHRVIFYNQRGSGNSAPIASVKNNTTQDLISDVDKLRDYLKIDRMYLSGGSWGSTMALLYAIAQPSRVISMVLWSIFLAEPAKNHTSYTYMYNIFPEAWERFISFVPKDKQNNWYSIAEYYNQQICLNNQESIKYANEWSLWGNTLMSVGYSRSLLELETINNTQDNLTHAKIELYYMLNNYFIEENYILNNINAIKNISAYVVQGRFDMCTPAIGAYKLKRAYEDNMTLQFVNSGHKRSDPEMSAALTCANNIIFT